MGKFIPEISNGTGATKPGPSSQARDNPVKVRTLGDLLQLRNEIGSFFSENESGMSNAVIKHVILNTIDLLAEYHLHMHRRFEMQQQLFKTLIGEERYAKYLEMLGVEREDQL